jgi:hypothetical protein
MCWVLKRQYLHSGDLGLLREDFLIQAKVGEGMQGLCMIYPLLDGGLPVCQRIIQVYSSYS